MNGEKLRNYLYYVRNVVIDEPDLIPNSVIQINHIHIIYSGKAIVGSKYRFLASLFKFFDKRLYYELYSKRYYIIART